MDSVRNRNVNGAKKTWGYLNAMLPDFFVVHCAHNGVDRLFQGSHYITQTPLKFFMVYG